MLHTFYIIKKCAFCIKKYYVHSVVYGPQGLVWFLAVLDTVGMRNKNTCQEIKICLLDKFIPRTRHGRVSRVTLNDIIVN